LIITLHYYYHSHGKGVILSNLVALHQKVEKCIEATLYTGEIFTINVITVTISNWLSSPS